LGGQRAFSGKEVLDVSRRNHFEDDVGGLNRERLTVGDPRHEWYVDWLVLQTK
jgi:hypothetical protein